MITLKFIEATIELFRNVDLYYLENEKSDRLAFFFPAIISQIISAAMTLKVIPLPPKPNA